MMALKYSPLLPVTPALEGIETKVPASVKREEPIEKEKRPVRSNKKAVEKDDRKNFDFERWRAEMKAKEEDEPIIDDAEEEAEGSFEFAAISTVKKLFEEEDDDPMLRNSSIPANRIETSQETDEQRHLNNLLVKLSLSAFSKEQEKSRDPLPQSPKPIQKPTKSIQLSGIVPTSVYRNLSSNYSVTLKKEGKNCLMKEKQVKPASPQPSQRQRTPSSLKRVEPKPIPVSSFSSINSETDFPPLSSSYDSKSKISNPKVASLFSLATPIGLAPPSKFKTLDEIERSK